MNFVMRIFYFSFETSKERKMPIKLEIGKYISKKRPEFKKVFVFKNYLRWRDGGMCFSPLNTKINKII